MSLGTRLAKTAARLVDKHGATVTVIAKVATPKVDGTRPWRGSATTASVPVRAVEHPYTEEEVPDSNVRRGKSRFIIAAQATGGSDPFTLVDLLTATSLTDSRGVDWSLDDIQVIQPGDVRVLYLAEASR